MGAGTPARFLRKLTARLKGWAGPVSLRAVREEMEAGPFTLGTEKTGAGLHEDVRGQASHGMVISSGALGDIAHHRFFCLFSLY